jgi:hypothetical protein
LFSQWAKQSRLLVLWTLVEEASSQSAALAEVARTVIMARHNMNLNMSTSFHLITEVYRQKAAKSIELGCLFQTTFALLRWRCCAYSNGLIRGVAAFRAVEPYGNNNAQMP